MSRYRPPGRPSSPYITPAGHQRLQAELDHLWREERPRVTQQVSDAAALGDRSENAEYIYGKKRLREIDRRVRYLRKRLDILTVVDQLPSDPQRVYFGAWVDLIDEEDNEARYRLVGADELDPAKRHISIDSPLGKALLGKALDDVVAIQTPAGPREYEVCGLYYQDLDSPAETDS